MDRTMFAPATQQQQPQKQPAGAATAEEEALKRNTDCVYFLASPLTCKKGSECEYRHSEYARVNPRDCYYWLNGNCLNFKCGFRHPPLDGLLGNQGGAPTGPSHAQAPLSAGKQAVPCVFFQKGMCIKGDRCAFVHVPVPAANKMQQQPVETAPATEPQSSKKPFQKVTEVKKFPSANLSKAVKAHVDKGATPKVTDAGLGDSRRVERYVPHHVGYDYETVGQKKAVGVPLFTGGGHSTPLLKTHGSDDNISFQNGNDPNDVLRESSPGFDAGEDFDVLVDNELRDSEYYHGDDRYGRRAQDGRNSVNEYHPDFNAVPDVDAEAYRGFDRYNHTQDRQYAWDHHRASAERGDNLEGRVYLTDEMPDHVPESDLRHRLSKHRRGNGPRSDVGCEDAPDYSERGFADSHNDPLQESFISSRLQGRIKLPGRVNSGDAHFERGIRWGRNRSQLSPGRQGRFQDRIRGSVEENHCNDEERGTPCPPWMRRREMEDERNSDFPAPKRLAELRSRKEESKAERSHRKRKSSEDHRRQESHDSFVAPLPLSEILKRKRAAVTEKNGVIQETKQEDRDATTIAKEEGGHEPKPAVEDKPELGHDQSSEPQQTHEPEKTDEGTMAEDQAYEGMAEDQAYEGDDPNGEYYYEQGYEEDGEYNYEEGENAEVEYAEGGADVEGGEEGEEDGGNEFAKKIDVMF
ncbi:PREDICTED: zinc finger CCCH domain-containing protein 17-like [Tarenaya hassleriana]|uniref:zinc finger CCCH domain-containing protein 17-like n=1 Tax=Tarenaya hassleriana TaxID=28532 RepID=UPI00053C6055|nr:PREDICTED: zinc finger CCCH domain-containing protein 17-like [Tarenaya hassleriana]